MKKISLSLLLFFSLLSIARCTSQPEFLNNDDNSTQSPLTDFGDSLQISATPYFTLTPVVNDQTDITSIYDLSPQLYLVTNDGIGLKIRDTEKNAYGYLLKENIYFADFLFETKELLFLQEAVYIYKFANKSKLEILEYDQFYYFLPAWAFENTRVSYIYRTENSNKPKATILNIDDRSKYNLDLFEMGEDFVSWSPDGKKFIVLTADSETSLPKAYLGNTSCFEHDKFTCNSQDLELLNSDPEIGFYSPSWSPNSAKVMGLCQHNLKKYQIDLCLIDLTLSNQITFLTNDFEIKNNVKWSPDGQWVAYESPYTGDQIYISRYDTDAYELFAEGELIVFWMLIE